MNDTGFSLFSKKNILFFLGCLFCLFLFFFIRGCSSKNVSDNTFRIGEDARWLSLNLTGKERNLNAFNHELLDAIAKKENFRIHIASISQDQLRKQLEDGYVDGILTSLSPNFFNERQVVFSDLFFPTGPVLITSQTTAPNTWNERRKKILGVYSRSSFIASLQEDPSVQIIRYDEILSALGDLRTHTIDGAVFPAVQAYTYVATFYPNDLKITTLPLTDEGIRLVALKNAKGERLIERFNSGLQILKEEGAIQDLLKRWGFINPQQLNKS